jgi:fatty-acyl-CoA synthase
VPVDVDVDADAPDRGAYPAWADRLPAGISPDPIETSLHTLDDLAAYLYTSGTTGAPKAALVKHSRFYRAGRIWGGFAWQFQPEDVLYIPLPLYHGNAMILGTSSVIAYGTTIALARKFSASAFWTDCRRYNATCFNYIGELCRYLHAAPRRAADRDHAVRAISGNGLRADIWESFQARFGIERIAEFYASTEGNVITLNLSGPPGSVGRMIPTQAIVKWDDARQDFDRDAAGHLQRCRAGEAGVMLGKISDLNGGFAGYRDPTATERKIVRDAFERGDAWFNTGDLLRHDLLRNLYFVDRLGDTFRWKGENVSTFEVEQQIAAWSPVREANVYGVAVPGTEGRAGMAALVLDGPFDPTAFKTHVDAALPKYARPVFVRVEQALKTTSTLKLKKQELQAQGFDPAAAGAPLFVRRPDTDEYVPLDAVLHGELIAGRLRL